MIVAINKDPQAPTVRLAHCAVVADLNEILPELTREVRSKKQGARSEIGA